VGGIEGEVPGVGPEHHRADGRQLAAGEAELQDAGRVLLRIGGHDHRIALARRQQEVAAGIEQDVVGRGATGLLVALGAHAPVGAEAQHADVVAVVVGGDDPLAVGRHRQVRGPLAAGGHRVELGERPVGADGVGGHGRGLDLVAGVEELLARRDRGVRRGHPGRHAAHRGEGAGLEGVDLDARLVVSRDVDHHLAGRRGVEAGVGAARARRGVGVAAAAAGGAASAAGRAAGRTAAGATGGAAAAARAGDEEKSERERGGPVGHGR
jgi:hypothetical protein